MRLPTGNEKVSHAGVPEKNQWERRRAIRVEGKVSVNHGNRNDDSACSSANRREPLGRGGTPAERIGMEGKRDSRYLRTTNHPQQFGRSMG